MMRREKITLAPRTCLMAFLLVCGFVLRADETNVEDRLRLLQQQNDALQLQLRRQQELIDALRRDVSDLRQNSAQRDHDLDTMKAGMKEPESSASRSGGFNFGKVNLSGEGGVAFFETGSRGAFPNAEFRVDEAKLFVDAQVWGDVYAFGEINLASHESSDVSLQLGELYVGVEDISKVWGHSGQLNARLGRMDIPFGEEYSSRDAIDNPLISHSLSDFWGVDEGVELYGSAGKFSYVVAVQNGGVSDTHDFTADKSVAGRLSFDPNRWLHLSVSGMRTGDLSAPKDYLSALWFGAGWFRPLTTNSTVFRANLVEGDVTVRLPRGHLSAFGGYISYNDNDPTANNRRDVYYYALEGVHDLAGKLYGAARFSQIFARKGFPIVANGNMGDYLFGPLTDQIWRLSLGLGYRWNPHFVVKTEYSIEQGHETGGATRNHEDLFAAEAAFGF